MVKKIKFESFKYRFLIDASKLNFEPSGHDISWTLFLENLNFKGDNDIATISWDEPIEDSIEIDLRKSESVPSTKGVLGGSL